MREHPLTASPLHAFVPRGVDPDVDFAKRPYDRTENWPSELGDDGRVGWNTFAQNQEGWLDISYPHIWLVIPVSPHQFLMNQVEPTSVRS